MPASERARRLVAQMAAPSTADELAPSPAYLTAVPDPSAPCGGLNMPRAGRLFSKSRSPVGEHDEDSSNITRGRRHFAEGRWEGRNKMDHLKPGEKWADQLAEDSDSDRFVPSNCLQTSVPEDVDKDL